MQPEAHESLFHIDYLKLLVISPVDIMLCWE